MALLVLTKVFFFALYISRICVFRSEFLAILRDMVNSRPDLYEDMVGLTNEENIEDEL